MPCDNVTELMRIEFDRDDKLRSYRFLKKTCGGAVGAESLLEERLRGRGIAELLELHADSFCRNLGPVSDIEAYLNLKHFFAIRSVLEALSGRAVGGGHEAVCTLAEINYDDAGLVVDAEIAVTIVTGMIQACGHCSGG